MINNLTESVSKSSNDVNFFSIILATIFVIVGVILGIRAIVPYSDNTDKKCGDDLHCFDDEKCDSKSKKCVKIKKKHYKLLIVSFVLFIIAFGIIWFSKFYKTEEVIVIGNESDMLKKYFGK